MKYQNKNILKITFFILFIAISTSFFSQNNSKVDSLEVKLKQTQTDSVKNKLLNEIFNNYITNDWEKAINTAKKAISIFEQNEPLIIDWYRKIGNLDMEKGMYSMSLRAYNKALVIINKNNDNAGYILLDIAKIYYLQEEYDKAIDVYNDAIKQFEKNKSNDIEQNQLAIAKAYNKLGIAYELKGDIETSKEYFLKALKLRLKIDNKKAIADSYTSLGYLANVLQQYDSAEYYFTKGLQICNTYKNYYYFNDLHLFRSKTYSKIKEFNKAKKDIDTALEYSIKNNKYDLSRIYYYYAKVDAEEGDYKNFIKNINTSIQYADSFNLVSNKLKALNSLISQNIKHAEYKQAYENQLLLNQIKEKLENQKQLQLEAGIDLEIEKRKNIEQKETIKGLSKEKKLLQYLIIAGIVIFILLIILLIFLRKNRKKVSLALEIAKKERINAENARKKLEDSTQQIRSQAALSEILRNVTGKERSIEKFLNDALNKLLELNWLDIVHKGTITLIKDKNKEEVVAEIINENETIETEEINKPLIIDKKTFGNLTLFKEKGKQLSEFQENFISSVAETLASVINRKLEQEELNKIKEDLEQKNKHIRKYLVQLEQQGAERESLNQMILAQKKQVEEKNKQVQIQRDEVEQYAKQLEKQSLKQEKVTQELFAQKLEVEQRNFEVEQYTKQLEEQAKEQEVLNQKLFTQKLEVEQRNMEVELYTKKLEEQAKEQEKLNQQVFAQKLEVEQRNMEVEQYAKQLEEQAKEQEKLNQELFAQKMEVEQRNMEVVQYMNMLEEQAKEQEVLNQRLFAQSLEVEQKSFEIESYSKELEVLKEKAESTLKHLNDSINYSKYIQDSLLPLNSFMEENIPGDYFIYYQPKETIGGDFYYANKVEDYLILAVADCTGHGVPGALITMLGITFLNDIVERNLVENTGEALNFLRKRIKTTFRSYGSNLQNKNGLDIVLCAIDLKTNIMQYSGAFNPLFIFRDDELMEYKATRNPIGYYPVEKNFETTEIKLQKDDVIYLFSDGYSDQVGGPKGRKFSKRQFKDFLHEIHKFPMAKQSVFVDKIMQKWMGNNPQVDDMTLMGIKWDNNII